MYRGVVVNNKSQNEQFNSGNGKRRRRLPRIRETEYERRKTIKKEREQGRLEVTSVQIHSRWPCCLYTQSYKKNIQLFCRTHLKIYRCLSHWVGLE